MPLEGLVPHHTSVTRLGHFSIILGAFSLNAATLDQTGQSIFYKITQFNIEFRQLFNIVGDSLQSIPDFTDKRVQ